MKEITEGPLLTVIDGKTAKFILNRPDKKNAINNSMLRQFVVSFREAIADNEIRSVVLTGQGPSFSSGRDIKEFDRSAALEDMSLERTTEPFLQTLTLLLESPKPTVAVVRGFALGGGQALTLACDFVIAERSSKFGNVEMSYGFPAAMNIVLLCRHLGRRLGLEIALTGQLYTAERYREIGLINRLVDEGDLEPGTKEFVEVLNIREPWAVARTKDAFFKAEETTLKGGLYIGDQLNQLLRLSSQTQSIHSKSIDIREGLKAAMKGSDKLPERRS